MPADGRVMTLPQRPYLPIGSLADAISYPATSVNFDAAHLRELLNAVGLQEKKLPDVWHQNASDDEQCSRRTHHNENPFDVLAHRMFQSLT